MTYKLFIWKIKDKYIAAFPEIESSLVIVEETKEEAKKNIIKEATRYLKSLKEYPKNKNIEDLMDILNVLPEEDLISSSGINFE